MTRPIHLGCFDVRNGSLVVADDSLPIAVDVDRVSGAALNVFTWPLSPEHRGRPVALDILALGDSIVIASPAAGGIVDIDRRSGSVTFTPLDADVGTLIACGDTIWAVAGPDWDHGAGDEYAGDEQAGEEQAGEERPDGSAVRKRPVVWQEPTGEDIALYQEVARSLHSAAGPDDRDGGWTLADWREAEGDDEDMEPPTPIWRVSAGAARRIDVDLEQPILVAAGNRLAGVARLPGDPIIKHLLPDGSVSWRYPGSVIVIDDAGTLEVLGPVPSSGGVACSDHGRVWLLGFDEETSGDPAPAAREALPGPGRVAGALDVRLHGPVAVLDQFLVDLDWPQPAAGSEVPAEPDAAVVRFLPVDGGGPREAGPAGLTRDTLVRTGDGEVWFGNPGAALLTVAAPGSASVRELHVAVDCRPWMPPPQRPADFDSEQFERAQLDRLCGAFLGGWRTSEGDGEPFIEGVSFDAVELRGDFPDREVVALFSAPDRPGIQFGRRWRLYDELGNPCDHDYADIALKEDVESAGGGLPPLDGCVPDQDEVVWFQ